MVYPQQAESVLPRQPRGRGPSSCSRWALTLASPGAALGVRVSPPVRSCEGQRGREARGEWRVPTRSSLRSQWGEAINQFGYWKKSLYKGGRRGRSSELWRRTSEQSVAGRTVPWCGSGCTGKAKLRASTCPSSCSHPKLSYLLPWIGGIQTEGYYPV